MTSSGQKYGRAAERSNFVNQLSQYLKEKRNNGDLAKGPPAMMNLLSNMENSTGNLRPAAAASASVVQPSDFWSKFPGSAEEAANKNDFRKPDMAEGLKAAPLTIFFAGQVFVFNDFPADKVKEIMALAKQRCSGISTGFVSDSQATVEKLNPPSNSETHIPDLNIASTSGSSRVAEQHSVDRAQAISSGLQLGRRNSVLGQKTEISLHRFFKKRRERFMARAPYQIQNPQRSPSTPDDRNLSPEEGQTSKEGLKDLDLKL
ncbi:hypothetical protein SLEP1_g21233 [Rubroshorea leprosula]|uniref:Protein TIFY n=1 Tax=Rubroshorea leprosula TaxID=152421 RepID=A0AAV5J5B4_9ROSI|nr:hypothetical protein SLEP1_g21233 [Rubroshorea leprosula]